jgi:hypothetical protein
MSADNLSSVKIGGALIEQLLGTKATVGHLAATAR